MCDTFICPPHLSKNGHAILGKNSDRDPNEAQLIQHIPSLENKSVKQKCSFIEVNHCKNKFEIIISRPIHLWGAEMGVNEKGVAIGNEAVFTKMPIAKLNNGLTGMDMLRLALESCSSAKSAVEKLIQLNHDYGQDANGGYLQAFYYHNSFLVSDAQEAYVLETAGEYWALEKIKGHRAISNGLSIGTTFDDIHPKAIPFAQKKGWASSKDFHFAEAFSAFWMPKLAACKSRRNLNEQSAKAGFSIQNAFSSLRNHGKEEFNPSQATTASVCMHASGLFCPQQTTASVVVELKPNPSVWLTGGSAPCLNIFTPFYFGEIFPDQYFEEKRALDYWLLNEKWHRKALQNYSQHLETVAQRRATWENEWISKDESGTNLAALSSNALQAKIDFLRKNLQIPSTTNIPWLYKKLWQKHQNQLEKLHG